MQRKAILALLLLCSLAASAGKKNKKPDPKISELAVQKSTGTDGVDYKSVGSPMPSVRAITAKGEVLTNETLKTDGNLFVMMFNPTCEHCEDMTRALEKSIGLFNSSTILLLAGPMMLPYFEYFDKNTNYTQFPSIRVGVDSAGFIENTFTYQSLPQINIYDKDRKLIRSFSGINTIDSLRPYIH